VQSWLAPDRKGALASAQGPNSIFEIPLLKRIQAIIFVE
jgi:hypothetical protein